MQELRERLIEVWREHQKELADRNQKLVEAAIEALKDKKIKAEARVSLMNFIKGGGNVTKESSSGMTSDDRLGAAKAVLQNAENTRNALASGGFNPLLLEAFKTELESYRKELERAELAIDNAKNEYERLKAIEERDKIRFKK